MYAVVGNGIVDGPVTSDPAIIAQVMHKIKSEGFLHIYDDSSTTIKQQQKRRKIDNSSSNGGNNDTTADGNNVISTSGEEESAYEGLHINRPTYAQM